MWYTIDEAPEGVFLDTAVKTDQGYTNKAILKRVSNLWYLRAGTQVAYTPTHFFSKITEFTPVESEKEIVNEQIE